MRDSWRRIAQGSPAPRCRQSLRVLARRRSPCPSCTCRQSSACTARGGVAATAGTCQPSAWAHVKQAGRAMAARAHLLVEVARREAQHHGGLTHATLPHEHNPARWATEGGGQFASAASGRRAAQGHVNLAAASHLIAPVEPMACDVCQCYSRKASGTQPQMTRRSNARSCAASASAYAIVCARAYARAAARCARALNQRH